MAECRYCGAEVAVGKECEYCGRLAEPMYYPNYKPVKEEVKTPPVVAGKDYTVVKGDTLWSISKRAYGRGSLYSHIVKSNKGIKDPNRIHVGQVIFIPPYVEGRRAHTGIVEAVPKGFWLDDGNTPPMGGFHD